MIKINNKKVFVFLATIIFSTSSFADQSIGSVADNIVDSGNFSSLLDLLSGLCYIIGVVFAFKAATQLKDHTSNPNQHKLSQPMVSMAITAALLSMPSFLTMLMDTLGFTGNLGAFSGFSAGTPSASKDLGGMFVALSSNIPAIMKLVTTAAMVGGGFMILKAILTLPQVEQGRAESGKVIWHFIAGIGLWSIMPMITTGMATLGASSTDVGNILTSKYNQASGGDFDAVIAAVMVFVQLLGLIAFIRGVLILKALGENKDGAMGRALTHIFGGAAAINIAWAVKVLAFSIGATSTICGISVNLCA